VDADGGQRAAGAYQVDGQAAGRGASDRLEHGICAAAVCDLADALDHVTLAQVERAGLEPLGQGQSLRDRIHGKHVCRTQITGTDDRHQPDWAASQHDVDTAGLHAGLPGAEVAGRGHIAEQQRFRFADPLGNRDQGARSVGDPDVLRLRAVETPASLDPTVELPSLATGRQTRATVKAAATARRERTEDTLADRQSRDLAAALDDFADELVTHHGAAIESRLATVVDVQVRAADRRQAHTD